MAQQNILWRSNTTDYFSYIGDKLSSMLYDEGAREGTVVAFMTAHNAANDVKAWEIPNIRNVYKAHNSIIFRSYAVKFAVGGVTPPAGAPSGIMMFISGGAEYTFFMDITANGDEVELQLADRDDYLLATLKADEFNGVADFNVSSIVCSLFAKDMSEAYYNRGGDNVVQETYLGQVFRVKNSFFPDYNGPYRDKEFYSIVNGVGQEKGDEIVNGGLYNNNKLLSSGKVINCGGHGKCSYYVTIFIPYWGSNAGYAGETLYKGYAYNLRVENTNNAGYVNALLPEGQKNVVYESKPDCNDVLIRWINSKGGFDAFAFPYRQFINTKVKTNQTKKNIYRRDSLLVMPEIAPYDITASRVLSVGKQVSDAELAMLEDMAISPYIEVFRAPYIVNENSGSTWLRVVVDNYDVKRNTGAGTHDFSIDLRLPDLNTTM